MLGDIGLILCVIGMILLLSRNNHAVIAVSTNTTPTPRYDEKSMITACRNNGAFWHEHARCCLGCKTCGTAIKQCTISEICPVYCNTKNPPKYCSMAACGFGMFLAPT